MKIDYIVYGMALLSAVYSVGLCLYTLKNPVPKNSALFRLGLDLFGFLLDFAWVILLIRIHPPIMPAVCIYLVRAYIIYFIGMKNQKSTKLNKVNKFSVIPVPVTVEACEREISEYENIMSLLFNAVDANKTGNSGYIKNSEEYPYFRKVMTIFSRKTMMDEYKNAYQSSVTRASLCAYCASAKKVAKELLDELYSLKDKETAALYFKRFMLSFMTFDNAMTMPVIFLRNNLKDATADICVRNLDYKHGNESDNKFMEFVLDIYKNADYLNLNDEGLRNGGFL